MWKDLIVSFVLFVLSAPVDAEAASVVPGYDASVHFTDNYFTSYLMPTLN